MGEYLNHAKQGEVKIGTCENLYYTSFQQFVEEIENGNLNKKDAAEYLTPNTFRFRFPFPDENIQIGNHDDYGRGVTFKIPKSEGVEISHGKHFHRIENENGALGFELPCIQSDEFPVTAFDWSNTRSYTIFEIVQQKLTKEGENTNLQTIVRCPYCKSMSKLSKEEAQILLNYTNNNNFTDLQKQIAKIAVEGYNTLKL